VGHLEGKGGEWVVAISRFQVGSPPSVSIKDRIILASVGNL
jgi:hypothetical protein